MVHKVGINGFGRLGRVIFRTCLMNPEIELSAINDPAIDIEYICYLIKFDSTHGKFGRTILHTDKEIIINDRHIKVFREKLPTTIPWQTAGVQYVVEASGMFTCLEKASGHMKSEGVKRVIVTAPSIDVPMVILGVNDHSFRADQKVLSCASSTLYCLAPIIKILEDDFGVSEGFITSIHAMTPSLKPLDGLCLRGKHWRDHRSIHQNIIPATTGACKALGKIIPQVKDKLTGLAFRVPIVNVSVLDLTVRLNVNTSLQEIVKSVEKASKTHLQNVVTLSNEKAVSSDFAGDSHSCIMDIDSSLQLKPNFYKIICWYENEYSYACRVLDAIFYSEKQFNELLSIPAMMFNVTVLDGKEEVAERDNNHKTDIKHESKKHSKENKKNESPNIVSSKHTENTVKINTNKIATPLMCLKKPMSSQNSWDTPTIPCNRDSKRRNEIYKVWNDVSEVPQNIIRQNRKSFFHSCMTFSPKHSRKYECTVAQEHLEDVRKEFCKMVNMTEDLLKRSCSKVKLKKSKRKCNINQIGSNTSTPQSNDKINTNNKLNQTNNPIFNVCGDHQKDVVTNTINNRSKKKLEYCNSDDKTKTNHKNKTVGVESLNITKHIMESNEKISGTKENLNNCKAKDTTNVYSFINEPSVEKSISNLNINTEFQKQIAKTVECNNGIQKCKKETKINLKKSNKFSKDLPQNYDINIENIIRDNSNKQQSVKTFLDPSKSTHSKEEHPDKYNTKDKYLLSTNNKMQLIDEELKKRNIVLINSAKNDTKSDSTFKTCSLDSEQVSATDGSSKNFQLYKQERENLNSCSSVLVKADGKRSQDTTITRMSNRNDDQDLYDKLYSTSASDSNNSFEINEKKSQILQIADLSNSLEDLTRLDKICRIIEISDELSDKLFSTLDVSKTVHDQKKWSFKDLCEKLKLDEFCNKVFGQTV